MTATLKTALALTAGWTAAAVTNYYSDSIMAIFMAGFVVSFTCDRLLRASEGE